VSTTPVAARDWIGSPFEWPPLHTLQAGDALRGCYALAAVQLLKTRQDKPYLRLSMVDRHGPVEGRMWEDADKVARTLRPGTYVGIRGRLEVFNNERQIKVEEITPLRVELDDLVEFLPRSRRPAAEMDAELRARVAAVRDPGLHELLTSMLLQDNDLGRAFRLAPAAKYNHHAYLGGLLEHSLSVATVCDALARHYGRAIIDHDLLISAALIHDIGKIREIGAEPGFPYTDEGKLLGHILIGLQIVADAARRVPALSEARLLLLQHLVASHQGRYEWQSPREPRILEGLLLHYADDLDAKVNQAASLLGSVEEGWTAYDRSFAREFLRHPLPDDERPDERLLDDPLSDDARPASDVRPHARGSTAPHTQGAEPSAAPEDTGPAAAPAVDSLDLFGNGPD
jgi:3'-5' exoribonuclease